MAYAYLDEDLFRRLAKGHTFDVQHCAELIDKALVQVNGTTGLPDRIANWLAEHPGQVPPGDYFAGQPRLIIDLMNIGDTMSQVTLAAAVSSHHEIGVAPVLFLSLRSLTLDIPMRVEVPLRAVFKQGADLVHGYTIYLHALEADDGEVFVYYGITKRPWNLRFMEHVRAGQRKGTASRRLFARTLTQLIEARVAQRFDLMPAPGPALVGMTTSLCLVGGTREQALETEEYLVDKYSLAGKHPRGLNMIPGGAAGIRVAERFRRRGAVVDLDETAIRETLVR